MRLFRVLPHLMLCLLLVFDGIGGAMAAVYVHAAPGAATAVEVEATAIAALDGCSDHHATPAGSDVADRADPAVTTMATGADDGHDCCDDAGASCACPGSNVSAIAVEGFLPRAGLPAALAVHPLLAGHASPRLPGPIRPPIA